MYSVRRQLLLCCGDFNEIYDTELSGIGILTLEARSKCYTLSTILMASSEKKSNFTNYIPTVDISQYDCCVHPRDYLMQNAERTWMKPLVLNNLKLDDLCHAQHKLQQFDEILQNNFNKSFYTRHYSWFTLTNYTGHLNHHMLLLQLPMFKLLRYLFRQKSCCGFPNICITNHNERLELTDDDDQATRLSRIRRLHDEEPSAPLLESDTRAGRSVSVFSEKKLQV